MNMSIGEHIKEIRTIKKLTQQELADQMGISRSYLGDLEKNRRNPSSETIEKLSETLGVSIFYLMRGIKTQQDENFFREKELKETIDGFLKKRPIDVINRMQSIEDTPENKKSLEILYYIFSLLDELNISQNEQQSKIINLFFKSMEELDGLITSYQISDVENTDDKNRLKIRKDLLNEFEDYKSTQRDLINEVEVLIDSI